MEWKRGIGNDSSKVFDERGRIVATCSPDDGTAIVRAVNTFDQAREALKLALDYYRSKGTQKFNPYEVEQRLEKALAAMEDAGHGRQQRHPTTQGEVKQV